MAPMVYHSITAYYKIFYLYLFRINLNLFSLDERLAYITYIVATILGTYMYSEKNELILFISCTVINHNRDLVHVKYTLALC